MNPDLLHPWLLPHLPGFGADATSTAGLMPHPGVDPAKLRALLQQSAPPLRSIGSAPTQGLPALGTDPHDVGNMALGDLHALVRGVTGLGSLEDRLAVKRGGMTHTAPAPRTTQEQLDAEYGEGDPLVAAAMPMRAAKPAFKAADDGLTYFEHYSPRGDLTELDPAFMGTAKAGAEKKRAGRVPMLHVYAPGATPEPQFRGDGMFKYAVPMQNPRIYDIASDPDGILAKLRKSGFDANKMEAALQKAGYDGYHNSEYYPEIVKLYGKHPVQPFGLPSQYAILTAENPGGEPASAAVNRAAQAKLMAELKGRGFKPVPAKGQYPEGDKLLKENSLLVPGMTKADALAVGKQYGQNSVITNEGFHDLKNGVTRAMGAPRYTDGSTFTQLKGGRPFVRDLEWDNTAPLDSLARVTSAAIRLPDGSVHTGISHWPAIEAAVKAGKLPPPEHPDFEHALQQAEDGFVDAHGQFLTRAETTRRMKALGHNIPSGFPDGSMTSEEVRGFNAKADSAITNKIAMLDAQIRKLQSRPGASPYTLRGLQQDRAKAQIDQLLAEHIRNRDLRRSQLDSLAVRGAKGIDDLLGPLDPDYTDHYDPRHVQHLRTAMQNLQRAKTPDDEAFWQGQVNALQDMSPQEYARWQSNRRFNGSIPAEMSWLERHIAAERKNLTDQFNPTDRITQMEQRHAELSLDQLFSEDFKNRMARYRAQDRLKGGSGLFR